MAKIALRTYLKEVEELIEGGQVDEAIAHCRQILQVLPKNIATYRLMGKAYLETQRYSDAADIFQRVLSSVPDDFVSQVGMSIIREDEGNLDASIWHMERAFETQPSNQAIQDEMRRLYGRRDGIEPPKIRLTRGALARMYAQGTLPEQAIAELRAALAEDEKRPDLEVLLANMYAISEKQADAALMCTALLNKFPYCLEANRLLAQLLTNSQKEEEAALYLDRVEELDPYMALVTSTYPLPENVPDNEVTVEYLDYQPGQSLGSGQPSWAASLGVELNDDKPGEADNLDWMSPTDEVDFGSKFQGEDETAEDESSDSLSEDKSETEEDRFSDIFGSDEPSPTVETPKQEEEKPIPDFLQDAGWEPDSGEFDESAPSPTDQEPVTPFTEVGEDDEDIEIALADIPDWLQDMQPEDLSDEETLPDLVPPPSSGDSEDPGDWLNEFAAGADKPVGEGSKPPEPLAIGEDESEAAAEETNDENQPQWLQENSDDDTIAAPSALSDDAPDWLRDLDVEEQLGEESAEETQDQEGQFMQSDTPSPPDEDPAKEISTPNLEDEDAAMAWMESLAAKQGVAEEELVTNPEDRSEETPEWLKNFGDADDSPEAEAPELAEAESDMPWLESQAPIPGGAEEEPASETEGDSPAWLSELGSDMPTGESDATDMDEDDGMAWMESLAAKQGVAEEELVTDPEERKSDAPDWLADIEPDEETAKEAPEASIPGTEEEDTGISWMDSIDVDKKSPEEQLVTPAEEQETEAPDWMQQAEEELDSGTTPDKPQAIEETDEEDMSWLSELEEEISRPEVDTPEPTPSTDWIPPEEPAVEETLASAEETPSWITGDLPADEPVAENSSTTEESPSWMTNDEPTEGSVAESTPAQQNAPSQEDTPSWLEGLGIEDEAQEQTSGSNKEILDWLTESEESASEEAGEPNNEADPPEWLPGLSDETKDDLADQDEPPLPEPDLKIEPEPIEYTPPQQEEPPAPVQQVVHETSVEPDVEPASAVPQPVAQQAPPPAPVKTTPKKAQVDLSEDLDNARNALQAGQLETAGVGFTKLIKRGRYLEDIIADIQTAMMHHPLEVSLWQLQGDAYMRMDRLQEALDSYSKAEDLLQ